MYTWTACLNDGTVIQESPGISTDSIPRDEVRVFTILSGGIPFLQMFPTKGKRLVFRIRRSVSLGTGQPLADQLLVGWAYAAPDGGVSVDMFLIDTGTGAISAFPGYTDVVLLQDEIPR